ncbi:hypothetical protein F7725_007921 [Dissostichus mawsoni]|uniref:Solute carrier family 10 member 1 n=1 Tax=Dissostichus mawsoni TaxID=36200 RepID=A0A7J5Y8S7_DISMA|nr:hypothetical protein F7725_007921 [Dissostichus mawsoni]
MSQCDSEGRAQGPKGVRHKNVRRRDGNKSESEHSKVTEAGLKLSRVGMSTTMNATLVYKGITDIYNEANVSGNGSVMGVLNIPPSLNKAINILTVGILFIIMISLGCTMEMSKIKTHLFKPKGVSIALLAQFGIMPLTAFSLAKILQMEPIKAVTVLICGCCPGGSLSNIFSLAMKGDMNLSIVMTTCSCIAALGLMPLLLYIYCQGFDGLEDAVPYVGIISALAFTLVPCAIGIAINHYKPKYSPFIKKAALGILTVAAVLIFGLSYFAIKDVLWLALTPDVLAVAALMPLIGFTLGYVMSMICRLSPKQNPEYCPGSPHPTEITNSQLLLLSPLVHFRVT